jgi:hypothetical protein
MISRRIVLRACRFRFELMRRPFSINASPQTPAAAQSSSDGNKSVGVTKKPFTLIGLDGRRVGEFKSVDELSPFEQVGETRIVQVHLQQNVWRILPISPSGANSQDAASVQQQSEQEENEKNAQSAQNKDKNKNKKKKERVKAEKEFRISNTIAEHDLQVKMGRMKDSLERGHQIRVLLLQGRANNNSQKRTAQHLKFSLHSPKHDLAVMRAVGKFLAECSCVAVPLKVQPDGSQLMVLSPTSTSKSHN